MSHKKKNSAPPKITIFELLAVNCPRQADSLLMKYNKPKASNHADLENKLVNLYQTCPDKKQLEKEFAEIHPHKEWIVDYVAPTPIKEEIKVEPVKETKKEIVLDSGYYPADGCRCQSCSHMRMSGFSNFSGAGNASQQKEKDNTIAMLALVSMVFIAGMVIHHNPRLLKA